MPATKEQAKFIRITKPEHLGMIAGLVKNYDCNTYGLPRQDRHKNWIVTMGYDTKPDSDWGRYSGHRVIFWTPREAMAREIQAAVRQALGWEA